MTDESEGSSEVSPERIRSIAVHREDVANALEATLRSDREVVLRVTPPFSGRMRARLHSLEETDGLSAETVDAEAVSPIHIDPRDLVGDTPAYPEADQTASEYPDADVETRREQHAKAVTVWREEIRNSVVSSVAIDGSGGTGHEVNVTVLG